MSDCDVIHSFTLFEKVKEETTGEVFYSWYKIGNYSCEINKIAAVSRAVTNVSETNSITFVKLAETGIIDDVTAAEHAELFSEWGAGISYRAGEIRKYGDNLYKCIQNHPSQEGWEPDKAVSLWKKIGDPTVEYPDWSQPVSAGDGYAYGAKVSHNGKHWHSEFQGENIWEPGVPGTEALWVEDP